MNKNDPQSSKESKESSQKGKKVPPFERNNNRTENRNRTKEDFISYAKSNQEQVLAYILLVVGLLTLLFVNNLLGGFIIGVVAGYYFARKLFIIFAILDKLPEDRINFVMSSLQQYC